MVCEVVSRINSKNSSYQIGTLTDFDWSLGSVKGEGVGWGGMVGWMIMSVVAPNPCENHRLGNFVNAFNKF